MRKGPSNNEKEKKALVDFKDLTQASMMVNWYIELMEDGTMDKMIRKEAKKNGKKVILD